MKKPSVKYLLTDVDDVLLDWLTGFKKFLSKKGYKVKTARPQEWDLHKWIRQSISPKKSMALVRQFNSSKAFSKLKAFPDALQHLPVLAKDYKIVAITSCSDDPKVINNRIKNLKIFGIEFEAIHCVDLAHSKIDYLKKYPLSIWIEDRPEGAHDGHELGHKSILITRDHNKKQKLHPQIKRVKSWHNIKRILKANVKKVASKK